MPRTAKDKPRASSGKSPLGKTPSEKPKSEGKTRLGEGATGAKVTRKRFVNLLGERENLPKFKVPTWMGRKELRMLLETEGSDEEMD